MPSLKPRLTNRGPAGLYAKLVKPEEERVVQERAIPQAKKNDIRLGRQYTGIERCGT
jgi:hypothetical protein